MTNERFEEFKAEILDFLAYEYENSVDGYFEVYPDDDEDLNNFAIVKRELKLDGLIEGQDGGWKISAYGYKLWRLANGE